MSRQFVNAEDIADGRWGDILQAAGLHSDYLTKKQGPCPMLCGGDNGGNTRFRFIDIDGTGHHYCNKCGPGYGFKLLQFVLGTDFRGAADWIREWAGVSEDNRQPTRPLPPPQPVRAELNAEEREQLRRKYEAEWAAARPITVDTPAWLYLRNRVPNLSLDAIPPVLRAVRELEYFDPLPHDEVKSTGRKYRSLGRYPGMLAAVQGNDGRLANLHRWFLTSDGQKADVPVVKKSRGKFLDKSYAVRMGEPVDTLAVCEGLESGLAIMARKGGGIKAMRGVPVWPLLSANGLRSFEIPPEFACVKRVFVFQDNDAPDEHGRRAGNDAARHLRDKLVATGRQVMLVKPAGTEFDFADINVRSLAIA